MMEEEVTIQAGSVPEIVRDQLDMLLISLARPVVQMQIAAFLLVLIFAWLIPELYRHRRRRGTGQVQVELSEQSRQKRWLRAIYELLTPLVSLLLMNIALLLFAWGGYPYGLLEKLTRLIWIWLIYRILLIIIKNRYGEAARPYVNRIVTPIFIVVLAVQTIFLFPGVDSIANAFINFGSLRVTLGSLVSAVIVLYIFIVGAWVVKQLMIKSLPSRLGAEPGVIESVATLTNYALLSLGIIVTLGILGLDFTSLAIIAGGLSVGIGIGLQDIVANFVSGLVLLFEQSLRPGDVVELDGRISRVEKISLRATVVRTRTNEELIIPNASFTTTLVKNYTRSERLVQVIIPFGVSYKSDPKLVRRLAIDASLRHPLVLPEPAPNLNFSEYGESSLNFNLLVSVEQPELTLAIRSDIYYMLWDVFAEHDIEIPFPQRDVNLGDGWEQLRAAS